MKQTNTLEHLHQLILRGAHVCTDSRKAIPGGVYFALKGDYFDGNDFAEQALSEGCQLAVVDNPDIAVSNRYLLVNDVLNTLQQLAAKHRHSFAIPVIGITGSNGKTTTKELINTALSSALNTLATSGNLNNHIGVPLTLLSLKEPLDIAIIEMGANHLQEIEHLCELALPGFGLITNVGKAHLEGFGSFDNVILAKTELYEHIKKHQGTLFVNANDEILTRCSDDANRIFFGEDPSCHCNGSILSTHPYLSMSFKANKPIGKTQSGAQGTIHSKLTGKYNFDNILAAVAIALYFGVDASAVVEAIEGYQPSNNRSQLIETAHNIVIMDAYNANPTSMMASVNNFSQYKKEGKTAVFLGDMLELGEYAIEEHQKLFETVQREQFTLSIFVGEIFSGCIKPFDNILVFPHVHIAAQWLKSHPIAGYKVLVKGSRGIKMESLLNHL